MTVSFENWFYQNEKEALVSENKPVVYLDELASTLVAFMELQLANAYIAGFNACRDKWGGLTYKETVEQEGKDK